jgi:signal transduction histidine kinase
MPLLAGAHDWSKTALGPVEAWPAPLKLAAELALASPLATMVSWGTARHLIYNQRCVPLLGDQPRRPGDPADAGAAGWAPLAGAIDQVMASDRAVEVQAATGFAGAPLALDWACTPIHDQRGGVGGVFVIAAAGRPREAALPSQPWTTEPFLVAVAHELRGPLSALLLWSRMLREGKLEELDRKKGLDMVRQAAEVQVNLVGELLDFARLTLGHRSLQLAPTALRGPLDSAVASVRGRAEDRGIALDVDLAGEGDVSLAVDPARLQQAWRHLLASGIQSTRQRGRLAVRARRTDAALEVTVAREGSAGVGPDHPPLGLFVARHLLALHGAELADDGPERRGTLVVRFPLPAPVR